jgi:hypothetical protein
MKSNSDHQNIHGAASLSGFAAFLVLMLVTSAGLVSAQTGAALDFTS